jgi:hypothetical protein
MPGAFSYPPESRGSTPMMVRIECTSCGHVGVVHAETLVRELAALRHDLSTLRRGSKRIASVAQLVSRYHTFSTGRDSRRRCAGRCSTAMRPVTRVVRAGGHVAERRDHFFLADNAGIRECRCVCRAVCTKRLLRLLRCHGRRRKEQCDGQRKYLHNRLHFFRVFSDAPLPSPRRNSVRRGPSLNPVWLDRV